MIPDVAKKGSSFKGALAYYLHDKKQEGESERLSSERVAWTETRNLMTNDPQVAGRVMAATAMDANRLKQEAGISKTGRQSNQHVYSYTLSWHPDEAKTLTRSEMVRAADETLRVLGADNRQALMVAHNDRAHPHVHIIVNRVSPEDGRLLSNSNDRLKLSEWALSYRKERGQEQYCPKRAENWAERLKRHPDSGKLKKVCAESDTPRSVADEMVKAKAANDPNAKKLADQQKDKLSKLAAKGSAMKERHSKEWKELGERFRDRKQTIYGDAKEASDRVYEQVKATYAPQWRELNRKHTRERKQFHDREKRIGGKILNAFDALIHSKKLDPENGSGIVTKGFNFLLNGHRRKDALSRRQTSEVKALSAKMRKDAKAIRQGINSDRDELLGTAKATFLSERFGLIERQKMDKAELQSAWRRFGEERKRSFEASRRTAQSKQEARQERSEEPEKATERETFKAASQAQEKMRKRSRGRSRRRKRE